MNIQSHSYFLLFEQTDITTDVCFISWIQGHCNVIWIQYLCILNEYTVVQFTKVYSLIEF